MHDFSEADTLPEHARREASGTLETKRLDETWATTDKIPVSSRAGDCAWINQFIRDKRGTVHIYYVGRGGFKVLHVAPMKDAYFICVTVFNTITGEPEEFIVPYFHLLGFCLSSR